MWPTFIAVTLVDALILHLLPPIGEGVDFIPALLISTFGNLVLIAVVAVELSSRSGVLWRLITFTYQANLLAAGFYLCALVWPRADARGGW